MPNIFSSFRFVPAVGGSFPTMAATATTGIGTTETSHAVNLPAGIASGNLLLLCFRCGSTNVTHTAPAGWTVFTDYAASSRNTTIFQRVADGSEGSTATVTTSASRKSAAITMRFTGQAASTPAEAGAWDTTASAASLTASGGSAKYLWLAFISSRQTSNFTAAPTDYSELVVASSAAVGGVDNTEVIMAIASREFEGSAQNPGGFTTAATNNSTGVIALIKPA